MRKIIPVLLMAVSLTVTAADTDEITEKIKEKYPATSVSSVKASPVAGVYEVVMGRNVAYTDATGRYMLFGHLYDMDEQTDLTAQVLDGLNVVDVSRLPTADAIKAVRGAGSRTLYLFSDPDCPFCKKIEEELSKIDDVTIYTFLYPLEQPHPDAKRKAEAIWCAKDQNQAWMKFMVDGEGPEDATCDNPVERNIQLGQAMGISGTPTMILEDGQIVSGALPAMEIENRLRATADRLGKGS